MTRRLRKAGCTRFGDEYVTGTCANLLSKLFFRLFVYADGCLRHCWISYFNYFQKILLSHGVQNYIKVTQRLNNGHREIHLVYHNLPQADPKRAYNELHHKPNIIFNEIFHAIALRQIWHERELFKTWNPKQQNEA